MSQKARVLLISVPPSLLTSRTSLPRVLCLLPSLTPHGPRCTPRCELPAPSTPLTPSIIHPSGHASPLSEAWRWLPLALDKSRACATPGLPPVFSLPPGGHPPGPDQSPLHLSSSRAALPLAAVTQLCDYRLRNGSHTPVSCWSLRPLRPAPRQHPACSGPCSHRETGGLSKDVYAQMSLVPWH